MSIKNEDKHEKNMLSLSTKNFAIHYGNKIQRY